MQTEAKKTETPAADKQTAKFLMQKARDALPGYLDMYLEGTPSFRQDKKVNEFEVRFGTNTRIGKSLSKIDYNNVLTQAFEAGYQLTTENGLQSLRISYYDTRKPGPAKHERTRVEIEGVEQIQDYCRTNSLQKLLSKPNLQPYSVKFVTKHSAKNKKGEHLDPLDFIDLNYRVSYQLEEEMSTVSPEAQSIVRAWDDYKKTFRMMNRVSLRDKTSPIEIDLSIVKMSKTVGYKDRASAYPTHTIQESGVFNSVENYEIELEIINDRVGPGTKYKTSADVLVALRHAIRIVLTGIQGTNYPIGQQEQDELVGKYMWLLFGAEQSAKMRSGPRWFIGPDSLTLQLENVGPLKEDSLVHNIRSGYTVTEKADGERRLLFVDDAGKIYLIDKNMTVRFSGQKTAEKAFYGSILDGEHIRYNRHGKYINLYAAFDIYWLGGKSVREFAFIPSPSTDSKPNTANYRLPLLHDFVSKLNAKSVSDYGKTEYSKDPACYMRIECKEFYTGGDNIFEACSQILSNETLFEYNTDGLIFTPANTGVCSPVAGQAGPLKKQGWDASFKWKPAEFNTVDFLVTVVKDRSGKDKISYMYQEGKNTQSSAPIMRYKTLELRCGYDTAKYVSVDPFADMVNGKVPDFTESDEYTAHNYEPRPFQPTNPYDPDACYCNIMIDDDDNMFAHETHDYFEESMIVEFSYNPDADPHWRWVPLRVRYDKTRRLRTREREYGNDFRTADNNWHSIHYAVTREMITSGQNIPELGEEKDVYYNRSKQESKTISLRNFHNLYVKRKLITAVASPGDRLIDYSVGKGGDLDKWIAAKLGFVFGVDISEDNIRNPLNGVCARYLSRHRTVKRLFPAIFVKGNSSLNIRSVGDAFAKDSRERAITQAVFGKGPKDEHALGKAVYRAYGMGENGFSISSCQFALHYFFESTATLHGFLRNLQECTKVQGYFVGTCYDGRTVFNLLADKPLDEGVAITTDVQMGGIYSKKKICEIIRKYPDTSMADNETSIGYRIEVFQETINKSFSEYLVNFPYLVQLLEVYGFTLITNDEARQLGLPAGTGMFDDLFKSMEYDVRTGRANEEDFKEALQMTDAEKNISFLNRYFVFRKFANVEAAKLTKLFANAAAMGDHEFDASNPDDVAELEKELEKQERLRPAVKGRVQKIGAKLVLTSKQSAVNMNETIDSSDSDDEDNVFEIKVKEDDEKTPPSPPGLLKPETEPVETKILLPTKKVTLTAADIEKMKLAKANASKGV